MTESTLEKIASAAKLLRDAPTSLREEADAWVQSNLDDLTAELESLVVDGLASGLSVAVIAEAYSRPGVSPNRNRIYDIKRKYNQFLDGDEELYPFQWVPREVETAAGVRTVHDIHAVLVDFGPESIIGDFTWRYDVATAQIEPVLDPDPTSVPYPLTTYYQRVLETWVAKNPVPEVENA